MIPHMPRTRKRTKGNYSGAVRMALSIYDAGLFDILARRVLHPCHPGQPGAVFAQKRFPATKIWLAATALRSKAGSFAKAAGMTTHFCHVEEHRDETSGSCPSAFCFADNRRKQKLDPSPGVRFRMTRKRNMVQILYW
jgi:hypothetical protein